MAVTRRHIDQKVDFRDEYANIPGVMLLSLEKRGRFDLALIRLPSGKQIFVDRSDCYPVEYPRKNEQGETVWACCESTIGRPCAHERHMVDVDQAIRIAEDMATKPPMTLEQAEQEYRSDS
jgi:hypothetical protein